MAQQPPRPFLPAFQCVKVLDCAARIKLDAEFDKLDATGQLQRELEHKLAERDELIQVLEGSRQHVQSLLLVVKRQLRRPLLELAYKFMGKAAAVRSFMADFVDAVLYQQHPLVQQIRAGAAPLPGFKPVKVDCSCRNHDTLYRSFVALMDDIIKLSVCYSAHNHLTELLLGLLTVTNPLLTGRATLLPNFCPAQLPCSMPAAEAWATEVMFSAHLHQFQDPRFLTKADLAPLEKSCFVIMEAEQQTQQPPAMAVQVPGRKAAAKQQHL